MVMHKQSVALAYQYFHSHRGCHVVLKEVAQNLQSLRVRPQWAGDLAST